MNLPKLYNTIRENPDRFAGYSARGIRSQERAEDQAFHQAWAQHLAPDIREGVQGMMERIFPKLDNSGRGGEFLTEWRRIRRAAHPDVFPSYFQFTVDADRLSRQAIVSFIEQLADPDSTERTLLGAIATKRADGSSKARDYLDYLQDYDKEIDARRATNLLNILGRIGDRFISTNDDIGGFFSIPSAWQLTWAMRHALTHIPSETRDELLIASFRNGDAVTYLCSAILFIEACHEKPVDHGPSIVLTQLSAETVVALKRIALDRIRQYAETGQLLDTPELPSVLIRWRDWDTTGNANRWADSVTSATPGVLRFMSTFLSKTRSRNSGDSVSRVRHTLHFKLMSDFVDLNKVATLLDSIENDTVLEPSYALTVKTFNEQFPLFKEGKDPDSPFVQMEST